MRTGPWFRLIPILLIGLAAACTDDANGRLDASTPDAQVVQDGGGQDGGGQDTGIAPDSGVPDSGVAAKDCAFGDIMYRSGEVAQHRLAAMFLCDDGQWWTYSGTAAEARSFPLCEFHGRGEYAPFQPVLTEDACNACVCTVSGQVVCTDRPCPPTCAVDGHPYRPGEAFHAADGCNVCTCLPDGTVLCSEDLDGPECVRCEVEGRYYARTATVPRLAPEACGWCECGSYGSVRCHRGPECGQCGPVQAGETYDLSNLDPEFPCECLCLEDGTWDCSGDPSCNEPYCYASRGYAFRHWTTDIYDGTGCFCKTSGLGLDYCNVPGRPINYITPYTSPPDYRRGFTFRSPVGCQACVGDFDGTHCSPDACSTECVYDGKTYAFGAMFRARDGCNSCVCGPEGEAICTETGCSPIECDDAGVTRHAGEMWSPSEREFCICSYLGNVVCSAFSCGVLGSFLGHLEEQLLRQGGGPLNVCD